MKWLCKIATLIFFANLQIDSALATCQELVSPKYWKSASDNEIIFSIRNCSSSFTRDEHGNSPLHFATGLYYGYFTLRNQKVLGVLKNGPHRSDVIFEELFNRGFNPNARNMRGDVPLNYYIRKAGNVNVIKLFIKNEAILKIKQDDYKIGSKCNVFGFKNDHKKANSFVFLALKYNTTDVVKYLLSITDNPDSNELACRILAYGKDPNLLSLLEEKVMNIQDYKQNKFDYSSFNLAASNFGKAGDLFLKTLLKRMHPDSVEEVSYHCVGGKMFITPMHDAAYNLDDTKIQILLDYGFESNVKNCNGKTAFKIYSEALKDSNRAKSEIYWRMHDQQFD